MARGTVTPEPARPIALVVGRHAEEAALLYNQRRFLAQAGHVKLHQLRRLDERVAAHLDGLAMAHATGTRLADAALANAAAGELFTAASLALDNHDVAQLDRCLAIGELLPEVQPALCLAAGWVSGQALRDITRDLLASPVAFRRRVAIAACEFHRVDPGKALAAAAVDADAALRAHALRAAGHLGRRDLRRVCIAALDDDDAGCRYAAARSAVLLGERLAPLRQLHAATLLPGPDRLPAWLLLLKLSNSRQASPLLEEVIGRPDGTRLAVLGAGMLGDPQWMPWMIEQIDDPALARVAGEAISMLTGLDLAARDMECKPPVGRAELPSDSAEDDDVGMDADDGLPWPDRALLEAWWSANARNFQPGVRYFMGAPPSPGQALSVLASGFQRQRIAAAQWLCLLQPGTMLFPTAAPAWRQQRWLDQMSA